MRLLLLALFIILFLVGTPPAFAQSTLPSVSVVNPLRGNQLGLENVDLEKSFTAQWEVTKKAGVKATWLWQYSALEEKKMVDLAKEEMREQEHGIFLEIDKNFADQVGVPYKGESSWYFSDGLLLVGYDKEEREKFITAVFEKFNTTFGYYPKTVGAWWVGAESIEFMQRKYGITGVIQCSDQFSTDAYSLWGTPWSIPYRPSKTNAAKPAASFLESSRVVVMQWAPRDPTQGYGKDVEASTYSMQDYPLKGYDHTYIDHLTGIFLKKPLDQVVIGLEGGLPNTAYEGIYGKQLLQLKQLEKEKKLSIQPVSNYANEFLTQNLILPPTYYFLSSGFDNNDQSFWINTSRYRVGIKKEGKEVSLIDLRDYINTSSEDFYTLPNLEGMLRINTKGVLDTVRFENKRLRLSESNVLILATEGEKVQLRGDGKTIAEFTSESYVFNTLSEEQSSTLQKAKRSVSEQILQQPYIIIGFMLCLYIIFLSFQRIPKDVFFRAVAFLVLSGVMAYPFMSSWFTPDDSILLSVKSLQVLRYLSIISFRPTVELVLLYQILPFGILLLVNYLALRLRKYGPLVWVVYLICIYLGLFFTADLYQLVPEYISQGKKAVLMFSLLVMSIVTLWSMLLFFATKKKWGRRVVLVGIGIILISMFLYRDVLAEKRIIITPFEVEALSYLYSANQDVVMLTPKDNLQYRAIHPLLNEDEKFYASLLPKSLDQTQELSEKFQGLLVVPRYLKREIGNDQVEKYNLQKVFDNAQIEIYAQK